MPTQIVFATGVADFEQKILNTLNQQTSAGNYLTAFSATHTDNLTQVCMRLRPQIVVIREEMATDAGQDFLALVRQMIMSVTGLRIIVITKKRYPGDPMMSGLIMYGVYDIVSGDQVSPTDVANIILHPNTLQDLKAYVPDVNLERDGTQMSFSAPTGTESLNNINEEPTQAAPMQPLRKSVAVFNQVSHINPLDDIKKSEDMSLYNEESNPEETPEENGIQDPPLFNEVPQFSMNDILGDTEETPKDTDVPKLSGVSSEENNPEQEPENEPQPQEETDKNEEAPVQLEVEEGLTEKTEDAPVIEERSKETPNTDAVNEETKKEPEKEEETEPVSEAEEPEFPHLEADNEAEGMAFDLGGNDTEEQPAETQDAPVEESVAEEPEKDESEEPAGTNATTETSEDNDAVEDKHETEPALKDDEAAASDTDEAVQDTSNSTESEKMTSEMGAQRMAEVDLAGFDPFGANGDADTETKDETVKTEESNVDAADRPEEKDDPEQKKPEEDEPAEGDAEKDAAEEEPIQTDEVHEEHTVEEEPVYAEEVHEEHVPDSETVKTETAPEARPDAIHVLFEGTSDTTTCGNEYEDHGEQPVKENARHVMKKHATDVSTFVNCLTEDELKSLNRILRNAIEREMHNFLECACEVDADDLADLIRLYRTVADTEEKAQ